MVPVSSACCSETMGYSPMTDFCKANASTVSVKARNVSSASASDRGTTSLALSSSEILICIK